MSPTDRTPSPAERFDALIARIQPCQRCPRMRGRTPVFGWANGSPESTIVFIAEAPGRLGANRTRIPLHGDQTGDNFEALLQAARLSRNAIFVTNAALCNPQDAQGRNASPTAGEVGNCASHLDETLALLQPRFVVTLGQTALDALKHIAPHRVQLARDVGTPIPWNQRILIPLYHPSPQACIHRSLDQQMEDYRRSAISSPNVALRALPIARG